MTLEQLLVLRSLLGCQQLLGSLDRAGERRARLTVQRRELLGIVVPDLLERCPVLGTN
jgi:hypothetical protein